MGKHILISTRGLVYRLFHQKNLRFVGIIVMAAIRETYLVCYPFQKYAGTIDLTLFEAEIYHFGIVIISQRAHRTPLDRFILPACFVL